MKLRVMLSDRDAITLGRDRDFIMDIDITKFSIEQRKKLAEAVSHHGVLYETRFFDETGNITPESVQKVIDKDEENRAKQIAENKKIIEEIIAYTGDEYICERDHILEFLKNEPDYKDLKSRYINARTAWKKRYDERIAKEKAEKERKQAEEMAKIEKEKREKEAEEAKKFAELTAAVQRLGTPLQKQKWADGLMARKEVIELLYKEYFSPLTSAGINWVENKYNEEERYTKKKTLTDEQYEMYIKIKELLPYATISFKHESISDIDYIEITGYVGSIELKANVMI